MLLVLDNCEHVVAACAEVAETLLWSCPHLRILATSREALGIPAEVVWRVPSLSLPVLEQLPPTSELIQYGAVRLFVERAAAVRSAFSLTDQNAPAVVAVCQRLDGIPLAIELAAARVPAMTVGQIAARLDDRFRLLTRGRGAALPRHQTLRAVMDWSYQLLADSEKLILRRLSVFAGGFTLEAAEAVCKGDEVSDLGVLDLLTQLVTKSLVLMDERDGDMRYRFLETVRQYAMDMLRTSGELPAIRGRHYLWFLSLAQQAAPELRRRAQSMWMDRLESEHDNFRAALEWTRDAGTADDAMRLAHALVWFWSVRGYIGEGRERLAAALSRSDAAEPTPTRAEALWAAGILARQQGDYGSARRLYEECLEIRRRLGDRRGVAEALNSLGLVVREQGDYAAAYAMHSESLQIRRSLGDDLGIANALTNLGLVVAAQGDYAAAERFHEQSLTIKRRVADELSLAYTMNNLGDVAYHRGDYDKARALYDESLSIKRRIGDKFGIAYSLRSLANVMYRQGDHASARALYAESLERRRTLGERSGIAECLEGLAAVATAEGRYERSATLFAAADALRENLGTPVPPADRTEHQRVLADVRASLGQVLFDNAWARGRAMSPEEAWEFASAEGVSQAARRSFPM
jgi:non-specific serine/threonine protein kinase